MVGPCMSMPSSVRTSRYDRGCARYSRRRRSGTCEGGEVVVGVGGLRGALVLGDHLCCCITENRSFVAGRASYIRLLRR